MSVENDNSVRYDFDEICTIYEAAQIHKTLEELLEINSIVELNVNAIKSVDASFIQLLASSHIQAKNKCVELKVTGESDSLSKFAETIHCQEVLISDVIITTKEVD